MASTRSGSSTTTTTTSLPNASLSWSQNRRAEKKIQPLATLDLHGYGREDAIRSVTKFWEDTARTTSSRRNPWVCIITGTGAHSGGLGGPILKQAIHKLLMKRQMEFSYCKKPRGMFLVNVHSGIVLKHNPTAQELLRAAGGDTAEVFQETPWQDTKVKVMQRELIAGAATPGAIPVLPAQKKKATGKKARKDMLSYAQASLNYSTMTGPQHERLNRGPAPRPSELAADQRMLEQAKSISLQDTRKYQSQRDKEENAIRQAIEKTQQEALEEKRLEEEELKQVLALSQVEQEQPPRPEIDEEAEMERILQLSLQEQQHQPQDSSFDEEEWQNILAQSNMEYMQQQQDEEAQLERVLRMSMAETQQKQVSPQPDEIAEEGGGDTMQSILQMSMMEACGAQNSNTNGDQWQGLEECSGEQFNQHRPFGQEDPSDDNAAALGEAVVEPRETQPTEHLNEQGMIQDGPRPSLVSTSVSSLRSSNATSLSSNQSSMEPKSIVQVDFTEPKFKQTRNSSLLQTLKVERTNTPGAVVDQKLSYETKPSARLSIESKIKVCSPIDSSQTSQHEDVPGDGLQRTKAKQTTLQPPSQPTSPTAKTRGEVLLESILYNKPLPPSMQPFARQETKKALLPTTTTTIQFNLDSPTRLNEPKPTLLQPSSLTKAPPLPPTPPQQQQQQQQQPVVPAAVLEHRLMEILQRPIVLPPSSSGKTAARNPIGPPPPKTGSKPLKATTLSPYAASFTPIVSQPSQPVQPLTQARPTTTATQRAGKDRRSQSRNYTQGN